VTPVQGHDLVWGTTETHQRREVPILKFRGTELGEHIRKKRLDDLVFAGIPNGQPLRVSTFRTAFSAAARAIGVPDLHPHQLRHTAASLAIALTRSAARWTPPKRRPRHVAGSRQYCPVLPRVAPVRNGRRCGRGPVQRFRWSGPLSYCVPPTGFEPALPP
jgi:hypothetical protein